MKGYTTKHFVPHRFELNSFSNAFDFTTIAAETQLFSRLRVACIDEEAEVARQILKMGKISNLDRYTAQSTLLCIASRGGSSEIFKILIEFGANPNATTEKGDTPLICAARNGHIECLEYLLDMGVNVNGRGHRGWSALHWAALNGRYEIAATLAAYGAEIDAVTDDGSSSIFLGCLSGHSSLVEDLIKFGSNVRTVDKKGDTPLHAAARQNGSSLKPLLKAGAEYLRNHAGQSPIDAALVRGHRRFIDLLLLGKHELRESFHFNAIELASVVSNDTRAFENTFKVLAELSKLDFTHFENSVEHIINKLAELVPRILSGQGTTPTATSETENAKKPIDTSKSNERFPLKREDSSSQVPSLTSSQALNTSNPSPYHFNYTAEQSEGAAAPTISVFKHLTSAFVNLCHDVLQTPKIRALMQCSSLRTKINLMMKPLDTIWEQLEQHIQATMQHLNENESNEEATALAMKQLSDIPSMIEKYYNISRMMMITPLSSSWSSAAEEDASSPTEAVEPKTGSFSPVFLGFIERIHSALRFMISNDRSLLTTNLHFVLDLPSQASSSSSRTFADLIEKLSFEQKRNWLRVKIETEQSSAKTGSKIETSRLCYKDSDLLELANFVNSESPENLRGKLFVKFLGELGVGAGVQREWFQFIVQKLTTTESGLFEMASDRTSFTPISAMNTKLSGSWNTEERTTLFKFFGRFLAMALVHEENLNLRLILPIYKALLRRSYQLDDMKQVDETVHQSMRWMLEHDASDLGLVFEALGRGASSATPLIENGSNIEVDDSNKGLYIEKLLSFYFKEELGEHLSAITEGFFEIVPHRYIAPFTESELELVISGQTDIDLADWKANTEYSGELTAESDVVAWFWNWMDKQNTETHRQVLQFVTGSSNVPLGGFKNLRGVENRVKFSISKAQKDGGSLPSASTCFNMLKMPNFESQADFEAKMLLSITEGRLGFSFN